MRRRELGVHRPPAPPPHPEPPVMPAVEDLHRWYVTEAAGVSVQPRTSREQRKHLDPKLLRDWYLVREWSAAQVAAELDTTVHLVLRTLHGHGIPVRRGGPPRKHVGNAAQARLAALYDDPDVTALLHQHRIPTRPMAGTITQRFPIPSPVTRSFLTEAYIEIGLAAGHIEQLTGQPAGRVLQLLHDHGIPVRSSGSQSPWLRRQRDL